MDEGEKQGEIRKIQKESSAGTTTAANDATKKAGKALVEPNKVPTTTSHNLHRTNCGMTLKHDSVRIDVSVDEIPKDLLPVADTMRER
eukprot:14320102-Ditylum_brightwellii.AAC.1